MLPLSVLQTAKNQPMLVELKNGDTYNGHLVNCDNFMNINLRDVIKTSRDGDEFFSLKFKICECRKTIIILGKIIVLIDFAQNVKLI